MKNVILYLLIMLTPDCMAQSFSINTDGSTAHASAILDVNSTTKGMLVPRMNKTDKNGIATPATGLLIFQNAPDSIGFHYYNGLAWIWLESFGNAGWKTTGNAGTDTAINFIGTTDNMPLRFKQNGQYMGQWDLNSGNYLIGDRAGILKPTAMQNSIAIGDSALAGAGSLISPASSDYSIAIGYKALKNHKLQIGNVAVGAFALQNFVENSGGGFGSVAVGYQAMNKMLTGQQNIAVGTFALLNDTSGTANTAIGAASLATKKTGNRNTAAGFNAGVSLRTGNDNTFLGGFSDVGVDSLQNASAIGAYTQVDTSNAMVLGSINGVNSATANVNVAIGTTKPRAALHVSRGSSGNTLNIPSSRISLFEDNSANYLQMLSPDANETGILAGNASTLIKSGIVFAADSAVLIRTGGNNTRIFAAKTGMVGIGNTNPQSRLHVSNGSTVAAMHYPGATGIIESSGLNVLQMMNPSTGFATLFSGTELTNARSGIFFNPDSSIGFNSPGFVNRLLVKNDGDVNIPARLAIGNNDPQSRFHVSNGSTAGAMFYPNATGIIESSGLNVLQMMNPSTGFATLFSGTELTNARSGIFFNPDSSIGFNSPGFVNRLLVKNDGDVNIPARLAIGNNDPQSRLHVSFGSTAAAMYNPIATGIIESSGFTVLQMMNPSSNPSAIFSGTELSSTRSGILFYSDSSIGFTSPGTVNRLVVKNDGDVNIPSRLAIGNNDPQSRLHVSNGSTSAAMYNPIATGIIESSGFTVLQMMNPSTGNASIFSGTNLTNARSGISFNADSSVSINAGGFPTRMIITKNGNTGINTLTPTAGLDANGTFKLGIVGTVNTALIKNTVIINVGSIPANGELDVTIAVANVSTTGAVNVSPAIDLPVGIIIGWARVSSAGNVRIRYRNLTGLAIDPPSISYFISVVQ